METGVWSRGCCRPLRARSLQPLAASQAPRTRPLAPSTAPPASAPRRRNTHCQQIVRKWCSDWQRKTSVLVGALGSEKGGSWTTRRVTLPGVTSCIGRPRAVGVRCNPDHQPSHQSPCFGMLLVEMRSLERTAMAWYGVDASASSILKTRFLCSSSSPALACTTGPVSDIQEEPICTGRLVQEEPIGTGRRKVVVPVAMWQALPFLLPMTTRLFYYYPMSPTASFSPASIP
eukprot:619709-Rhodomonas_salina.1